MPQFEVVFSESTISEHDAQSLLERNTCASPSASHPAYLSQPTVGDGQEPHDNTDSSADEGGRETAYELLSMPPHRFLCSIPLLRASDEANQTENELAKTEEARENHRATVVGWEMMRPLGDLCLYFTSGWWWSYRFCNNREIVQFHALSTANGQPPRPDPQSAEYVLGRRPATPATSQQHSPREGEDENSLPAELQSKGDQRYLVQRLEGGTVCDLTGRERTVEVQYHCVPGMKSDRIGWIKEVTICAYLMVIHTPRLCDDVAFLPRAESNANPISCQLVRDVSGAEPMLLGQHGLPRESVENEAEKTVAPEADEPLMGQDVTVGGIVVGSRQVLSGADEAGKPPLKLAHSKDRVGNREGKSNPEKFIEMIVEAASRSEGGKVKELTQDELEKLDLDPEVVRAMKEQMEKRAGDAGWRVEVIDLPGGEYRELRGYINEEEDEDGEETNGKGKEDGSDEKFFKDEL